MAAAAAAGSGTASRRCASARRRVFRTTNTTTASIGAAFHRCPRRSPAAVRVLRRRRRRSDQDARRRDGGFLARRRDRRDGDDRTRLSQRGVVGNARDDLAVLVVEIGVDARTTMTAHAYNTQHPLQRLQSVICISVHGQPRHNFPTITMLIKKCSETQTCALALYNLIVHSSAAA